MAMTLDQQRQEIDQLCRAVISEQDPAKLTLLVAELNDLLERRDRQIDDTAR